MELGLDIGCQLLMEDLGERRLLSVESRGHGRMGVGRRWGPIGRRLVGMGSEVDREITHDGIEGGGVHLKPLILGRRRG